MKAPASSARWAELFHVGLRLRRSSRRWSRGCALLLVGASAGGRCGRAPRPRRPRCHGAWSDVCVWSGPLLRLRLVGIGAAAEHALQRLLRGSAGWRRADPPGSPRRPPPAARRRSPHAAGVACLAIAATTVASVGLAVVLDVGRDLRDVASVRQRQPDRPDGRETLRPALPDQSRDLACRLQRRRRAPARR